MFNSILEQQKHNSHYLKRYIKFINYCKSREVETTYMEKHHICPSSLFPDYKDLRKNSWNKVTLTAREHYIAHKILALTFSGSMWYAFNNMMAKNSLSNERLYNISSRDYERTKKECSKLHSERFSGVNNPMYGKRGTSSPNYGRKDTEESKKRKSEALKGKVRSKEHSENISKSLSGRTVSEDVKDKISKSTKGIPKTKEHSEKIRASLVGKPHDQERIDKRRQTIKNKPVTSCPHCNKQGQEGSNMTRYHFDNCKFKNQSQD